MVGVHWPPSCTRGHPQQLRLLNSKLQLLTINDKNE